MGTYIEHSGVATTDRDPVTERVVTDSGVEEGVPRTLTGVMTPGRTVSHREPPLEVVDNEDRKGSPPLRQLLIGVDLFAIVLGWCAAFLTAYMLGDVRFGPLTGIAQAGFMVGIGGLLLSASGLYRRRICAIRAAEVARTARASLGLGAATVVVLASTGRDAAILAGLVGTLAWFTLLSAERGLFREWIHGRRAGGDFGAPVVVVGGSGASTVSAAAFLEENPVLGFEVRGLVCPRSDEASEALAPWLGDPSGLVEQVVRVRASGIVVDANSMTGDELNDLIQLVSPLGLHVDVASGLRGVDRRRITVSPLADETFLHIAPLGLTRRQFTIKRLVDVGLGGLALIALSPILAISALVIWAHDRGPVLFRQERVGQNGEHFTLYKLRTMVVDAEARRAELEGDNGRTGPLFKLARDPRITPFGRLLRATSIDEIPQLFNVLEGTMSLVGPRPALPDEVAQFDERLNARLSVKPGVTGLWQVEARDLPNFDLYRRYDLLYVQNWSVGLDLAVIARTLVVVLVRGVRAVLPTRLKTSTQTAGLE